MKELTQYQILSLLLPVQILLVQFISYFPNVVERYYSNGIYPFISSIFRIVFGWIPFSIGDIFYFLLGLFLLISIVKWIRSKFKNTMQQLFRLGAYLSVFYFFFHFLWGLNYYRNSLYINLKLERKPYTVEQLGNLTQKLLDRLEHTQKILTKNDTLPIIVPYSNTEILERTQLAYDALAEDYPEYKYKTVSLKKSLFSLPLSYMGFSGYLNPLSGEAQVNNDVPKVNLPTISCHEVAHQLGIGFENEANFIGFLAGIKSRDPYFNYSSNLKAFRFCVAGLHYLDEKKANEFIEKIPKGIFKNIKESEEFWTSYQNKLKPFFQLFYDGYLKANQQKEGLKTYSRMVDLLIAYDQKHGI
ncbi:DUF3810 domain-containing protein [Aureibaculum sp. 2210JD6-5]|uniref:DUF3810 domain-containing protein n=1 Tax=Aureibaculum sp. 2210JD6-5 TaxID=3103957 RepID=UPI002AAE1779|nr:DUF3810 domain-containing protein [Aureibaculum sp. 2210JD6-5]MDY7394240.1 DUF3810 domain-containing protein [Aureibaculum sp. 2210JD6-5]